MILQSLGWACVATLLAAAPLPDDAGPAGEAQPDGGVVTSLLRGTVRARGSRAPIPSAALLRGDGGEWTETDATGHFQVVLPPGDTAISVAASGYRTQEFHEHLEGRQEVEVIYSLMPVDTNPYQTIVRAERDRTEVSRVTLQGAELHEIAGTQGDPLRVVMLMPGVSGLMSGVSYPVVRSTLPAATGTYLDGVAVPQLFHVLLGPEVVHPDFIESIDFYPGLAPANFAGNLGGVVNGRIAAARDDQVHVSAYADLVNAGAFVEVPLASTGTNITLAGRYAYGAALGAKIIDDLSASGGGGQSTSLHLGFDDYQARVEQRVGGGTLRLLVLGSNDSFGLEQSGDDSSSGSYVLSFLRGDLRFQHPLGPGQLELGLTAGTEQAGVVFGQEGSQAGTFDARESNLGARVRYSTDTRLGLWAVGAEAGPRWASATLQTTDDALLEPATNHAGPLGEPYRSGFSSAAYAQDSLRATDRVLMIPQVRLEEYHLTPGIDRPAIEPQLAVRVAASPTVTLRAGSGILRQPPTTTIPFPLVSLAALNLGLQSTWQNELGVEWRPAEAWEAAATVYYDWMPRMIAYPFEDLVQSPYVLSLAQEDPSSAGRSWGTEVMIRKNLGHQWFGWASYGFQHCQQLEDYARIDGSGNYLGITRGWLPCDFNEEHVLSVTGSYRFLSGWTVGATLSFHTGRPETGDLTSTTEKPVVTSSGSTEWVPVELDQAGHLPPFFRADVRVSKVWIFDAFKLEGYVDVLDASLQSETVAYQYPTGSDPQGPPQPTGPQALQIPLIVPMVGVKGTY